MQKLNIASIVICNFWTTSQYMTVDVSFFGDICWSSFCQTYTLTSEKKYAVFSASSIAKEHGMSDSDLSSLLLSGNSFAFTFGYFWKWSDLNVMWLWTNLLALILWVNWKTVLSVFLSWASSVSNSITWRKLIWLFSALYLN